MRVEGSPRVWCVADINYHDISFGDKETTAKTRGNQGKVSGNGRIPPPESLGVTPTVIKLKLTD